MIFIISFIISSYFCLEFLKNDKHLKTMSPFFKHFSFILLSLYFIFGFFLLPKNFYLVIYASAPCFFAIIFFHFYKQYKVQLLLSQLRALLIQLDSQMKLGLSFMNAWEKIIQNIENHYLYNQLTNISEILKFEKQIQYSDPSIANLIRELIEIKKSPQPLKRLSHLKQKTKIEINFFRKTKQILFHLKIQSLVMTVLYVGLMIWTLIFYGLKYFNLLILSLFLFCIGLIWILKSGRRMKWSL